MEKRKIRLFAVGVALIALMLLGQPGITSLATPEVPKRIFADTIVGSDPFIEGLELIAAEDSAMITQYYQLGGQKTFPLNPSGTEFNKLDLLYIISSNQENWHKYWPRSIWEFRDGATVVLQFSQGLQDSLDDADEITGALNIWMGTTLDVLYGVYDSITGKTTVFYWGYMSPQNHSDFIYDEFYDVLSTGGFTEFITRQTLINAPVSVVGTGLVKNATNHRIPVAVTAFIQEDGIAIDGNGVHNMSIKSAFDYSGSIRASPNSWLGAINFQLPYVANVYDSAPKTSNLYPELTGKFDWVVKAGQLIDNHYDDVFVTYDMAVDELKTFPQISGEVSVDIGALHDDNNPLLNYTISMTNTGDETAYNTTFAWDLGDEPKSHYISVFNSDTYKFNSSIQKFYNRSSGLLVDEETWNATNPLNISITGWYTYHDDNILQPVSNYNTTSGYYDLDIAASMAAVNINKSFFDFSYSNNIQNVTLENGNFALYGSINELEVGANETFWWSVGDIPGKNDTFLILGAEFDVNTSSTPYDFNVTFFDNTSAYGVGNNLADYLIQEALGKGEDLRHPSLIGDPKFLPGVMFRYADNASREYFGLSNGLIVQLYDDEAILKTTVTLNSSIYRIDDVAQIDVLIENIGDADATDIYIQGFHAQLGPDWELIDIHEFSGITPVSDIESGKNVTHSFYRNVSTFLGLHPVIIGFNYTTEKSEGYGGAFNRTNVKGLASNLLVALVIPKDDKAGKDEPSYPTPVVNVSVSWNDENSGDVMDGDLIEIRTEVKNLGDEATTIKLFSYFPTRMASIDPTADYYDGYNYRVTDLSGNTIDPESYSKGFAFDHPDWPISVAAVEGLHLAPGATIVFYYKLTVTDAMSLIVPPVHVEYTSRYPMASASGMEGSGENSDGSAPLSIEKALVIDSRGIRFKVQQEVSGESGWTSYSGSSLLAAYAAVTPTATTPTTTSNPIKTTKTSGVNGFTTLTSFIRENMGLMTVVLAIPIIALIVKERRRRL
ncbi:MAG: hypothetical protein ACXACK_08030 [Candidatus Hodarchaeales archaeon]|jgi:hypothetical protein